MNKKNNGERGRHRYCVNTEKESVTTTVFLSDLVIEVTVYNDGNVVVSEKKTPPP